MWGCMCVQCAVWGCVGEGEGEGEGVSLCERFS